jgi:hypothetical protein
MTTKKTDTIKAKAIPAENKGLSTLSADIDIKTMVNAIYISRKDRLSHPQGSFDNQGRWHPSKDENLDNFIANIRKPSKKWPYTYLVGARSKKHIQALAECNLEYIKKVYFNL